MGRLKAEAIMICDFVQLVNKLNRMNIKQVTTVCDILNTCEMGKEMFKEYHKLIKLYLMIPITTATAEHTPLALL